MEKLTPQEEQAIKALWQIKEGSIKQLLETVEAPQPPYTTLASTVKNLVTKGYVQATAYGNSYIYTPLIKEKEYKKKFMQGFVADYFENSYTELVSFFVKEKKLSTEALLEIVKQIEESK